MPRSSPPKMHVDRERDQRTGGFSEREDIDETASGALGGQASQPPRTGDGWYFKRRANVSNSDQEDGGRVQSRPELSEEPMMPG